MRSAGVELSHDSRAALDLHACALAARGDAARLRRLLDACCSTRMAARCCTSPASKAEVGQHRRRQVLRIPGAAVFKEAGPG